MCVDKVTRRSLIFGAAATAAAVATPAPAQAAPGRSGLQDLTHVVTPSFPAFEPGEEPSRRTATTVEKDGYYMQEWTILEHFGTHVDAPAHFTAGGRTSEELSLSELITPAVVIDIARRAAREPDTTVTVADLVAYERKHDRIPRNAAVLMFSGWAAKAGDAAAYRGTDSAGKLHFPGFSVDACEWLLTKRGIRSLGVDTLSIDPGISAGFETHLALTGADRYGVENLAGLDRIPRHGATLTVGLIPYLDGSGGQARVFARW
ncbi:cyclase [Paractinoplanes abujensis]|uniref:Kynurenine formamidase n=1 Tax=Paractinoplanes abujensis TaxID=882441 RepID=A0A7W7FYT2_9ACTN|nr:cyclase family protein [Actinoplanes abujensis]MBB4691343.1 kynurenine formamidase [Actinoplanes abujensis]GID17243.1 cyclase [Actinoplanes abujensis]